MKGEQWATRSFSVDVKSYIKPFKLIFQFAGMSIVVTAEFVPSSSIGALPNNHIGMKLFSREDEVCEERELDVEDREEDDDWEDEKEVESMDGDLGKMICLQGKISKAAVT